MPNPTRTIRHLPRIDALVASGAFAIEDRRACYPPTGRVYVA